MVVTEAFLSFFSLVLKALGFVGILWEIRLRILEYFFGKRGVCIRAPTNHILSLPACVVSQKIKQRHLKCEETLKTFMDRIYQVNPLLNAVVGDRFEEAIAEARYIDQVLDSDAPEFDEIKSSLLSKSLLGVPLTVKGSLACKGLSHSAGLVDRKDAIATEDATVVENLRKAGAIPIAVTNCSELCMWFETDNILYGRTNNPYDTSKMVGGSSGGEGSIISAAGSVCGVGSDVGGSVRLPAFFNGIFAHKPSPSIIPNDGHLPEASKGLKEYIVMGPMCRYADDLVPLLKAMAGPKAHELCLDEEVDLSIIKVYTIRESNFPFLTSPVDSELIKYQTKVCAFLRERFGATVEYANMESFRYSPLIWCAMILAGEKNKLTAQILRSKGKAAAPKPFLEILKYTLGYSKYHYTTMAAAGIQHLKDSLPDFSSKFVVMGTKLREQLQDLLGNDGILLYPSAPNTAVPHQKSSLAPLDFSFTSVFNVMNLPVTQCPLGLDRDGLPLGIQIVAGKNNDKLSIAVAKQLENEFGGWREWYPGKKADKKSL
ncbi:fatty-acid amide hydrolase 2-like [Montipora capricornis]|uniref:fatty-acid amide hydrolase 2-like n=1 Tax=Montipora capricornis TaxID=246305 RepID=UPI0035F1B3E9